MISSSTFFRAGSAGVAAFLLLSPSLQATSRKAPVERYIATAINMGTPGRAGAGTVEIGVERWSTDADRDRLLTVLFENGADKLLEELRKMPRVGYIRTPNSIGYDLHYAHKTPSGDGERVVMATDRYVGFWEATHRPRTIDYPFTLIEMHLGADGRGQGKLSIATKIIPDKASHDIVLENYASQPVQLTEVHRETSDEQ
jgi:hypothetical protein